MVNRRLPVRSCRSSYRSSYRSEVSATSGGAGTSACANPGSPDYALPRNKRRSSARTRPGNQTYTTTGAAKRLSDQTIQQ